MTYNEFYHLVMLKQFSFIKKYKIEPKFIKVPLYWNFNILEEYNNILDWSNCETIAGLKICQTPTINTLFECEVF